MCKEMLRVLALFSLEKSNLGGVLDDEIMGDVCRGDRTGLLPEMRIKGNRQQRQVAACKISTLYEGKP